MTIENDTTATMAAIARQFATSLLAADISSDIARRDEIRSEREILREAEDRADDQVRVAARRLDELRMRSLDYAAAADAFLAGSAPSEIETESSLNLKLDGLRAARAGIRKRRSDLRNAEREVAREINRKLRRATEEQRQVLRDVAASLVAQLDVVHATAKVLDHALGNSSHFAIGLDALIHDARSFEIRPKRINEIPDWLSAELTPAAAPIQAAGGRILARVGREPYVKPEPEFDDNSSPDAGEAKRGRSASAAPREGPIRVSHLG